MNRQVGILDNWEVQFVTKNKNIPVLCPYTSIAAGVVSARDNCVTSCAAFEMGKPAELRQSVNCNVGNFVIGHIHV